MSEDVDRGSGELHDMVENHWRNLIRLAGVSPQKAGEEVFRFEALIEQVAAGYAPSAGAKFRNDLRALRGEYAERERADPTGLRKSLKVTGGGYGAATAWLANLETPASIDLKDQQDAFFRELLVKGISDRKNFQAHWEKFIAQLQAQVEHLPQPEQDGIMTRVVMRNAEYMALAQSDRGSLRLKLGLTSSEGPAPIAAVVVDTAARGTLWHGIGALFRAFR